MKREIKPRSPAEQLGQTPVENPQEGGLDELTAAFAVAAMNVATAIAHGKQLRTRDMLLRSTDLLIGLLLRSMEYPRDTELLEHLLTLAAYLTGYIDHIVLNAKQGDERLQLLCKLAENKFFWPTLVRPGDNKLTNHILDRLGVGSRAPLGALPKGVKRPPSLATPRNHLALRLVKRISNLAFAALSINRNGVIVEAKEEEILLFLRTMVPEAPDEKHTELVELLREAKAHPFCRDNLTLWNRLLSQFVLIIDPNLERLPELKQVRSAKGNTGTKGTKAVKLTRLEKFFHPALKNLLRS
jgi:hypothetical protein